MKKTILIVVLSVFSLQAYGQTEKVDTAYFGNEMCIRHIKGSDVWEDCFRIENPPTKDSTIQILLSEWHQYEKECYADSTLSYWYDIGDYPKYKWTKTQKYTHKEPSFPDFMLWLERKGKK